MGGHTTGFSVQGYMEGIHQKLHTPIEPRKVGTLPFKIAEKWMQIACPVVSKIVQSVNVLSTPKGHDKEQVHLCWGFASVHFCGVDMMPHG